MRSQMSLVFGLSSLSTCSASRGLPSARSQSAITGMSSSPPDIRRIARNSRRATAYSPAA